MADANPTLCDACRERLGRIVYVSCDPHAPGMDLLLLQLLERELVGEPGLEQGMADKWMPEIQPGDAL